MKRWFFLTWNTWCVYAQRVMRTENASVHVSVPHHMPCAQS
ncbi:hypothetical protein HMPREF3232_01145 [Fannyhessea vaginae]|nr:hypothetical protein HMPREF3232_01145 [Fannyhessea vaginae]